MQQNNYTLETNKTRKSLWGKRKTLFSHITNIVKLWNISWFIVADEEVNGLLLMAWFYAYFDDWEKQNNTKKKLEMYCNHGEYVK